MEATAEAPSALGGAGANVTSDGDFARDVALKTMAAIELSRLALDNTTRGEIKLFAQRLIDDHDAAAIKLKSMLSGEADGRLSSTRRTGRPPTS